MSGRHKRRPQSGRPKAQQRHKDVAGAPLQGPGETYRPPPPSACKPTTFFVPLDGGDNRLVCHGRIFKTRFVHFSIEHQTWWDGGWEKVARIDSTDTIHLHLWDRYGNVLIDHAILEEIPPSPDGQAVVHTWFERAYAKLDDEWAENLRKWSE